MTLRVRLRDQSATGRASPARRLRPANVELENELPAAHVLGRGFDARLQPPAFAAPQTLRTLQQVVGNAAVGNRVNRWAESSALVIRRDGPPTSDPSQETPTEADLGDTAKKLVATYADKYINQLSKEAKRRLAEAWEESPGGVIAAGAIIGGAGVGYLVGTKSALPGLPEIPLDFLGGPFEGATMKLEVKGPITSPESFGFKLTFKEQAKRKKKQTAKDAPPNSYAFANPDAIAKQVDGPAFEVAGTDADTNFHGDNLTNLVRVIGNGMLAGAIAKETRPYVDLGELPPTPPEFVDGLKAIIDALIAAAPSTLGSIEQVNFRIYRAGKLRFMPIRPTTPVQAAEP